MMKKKLQSVFCALLTLALLCAVCCLPVAAASPLTFAATEFGFAMVTDCDENASGVIKIPATVSIDGKTRDVKFIGEKAFANCSAITEIQIPEGVTQIGSKAFKNCESLRTVDIPKSLNSCEYDAFEGCEDVTVNCYSSNYQFFAVYGLSQNIHVNILDKHKTEEQSKNMNSLGDLIKRLIQIILSWFGIDLYK